ncbi:hypothetical protein ACXR0O_08740 [Verrucomicrobiota bacterium sgz303538]
MAVIVSMTYQKKLGLPQYSSHSCSLSVQVEVSDLSQVQEESSKLYELLQSAVDAEIQHVGFMPDTAYGIGESHNDTSNRNGAHVSNANGYRNGTNGHHAPSRNGDHWNCTDGQKGLILRVVSEGKIDKLEVENMAQQLFGVGVKQCDKSQASQLIEQLLEKTGKKTNGSRWRRQPTGGRA